MVHGESCLWIVHDVNNVYYAYKCDVNLTQSNICFLFVKPRKIHYKAHNITAAET